MADILKQKDSELTNFKVGRSSAHSPQTSAAFLLISLPLVCLKVAAGTLDASTKIYAVRVDAVHADAYRVLGGLGAETKPGEGGGLLLKPAPSGSGGV